MDTGVSPANAGETKIEWGQKKSETWRHSTNHRWDLSTKLLAYGTYHGTFPDAKGFVRRVKVKTQINILERPITKLCLLKDMSWLTILLTRLTDLHTDKHHTTLLTNTTFNWIRSRNLLKSFTIKKKYISLLNEQRIHMNLLDTYLLMFMEKSKVKWNVLMWNYMILKWTFERTIEWTIERTIEWTIERTIGIFFEKGLWIPLDFYKG